MRRPGSGESGKGALLAWHLARHPLRPDEALVVLDADNRVPAGLLARFADELDAGRPVVQAYLDTTEPDGSWLVTASALSYWASNRMVQLARSNLGLPCDLGGTGMCLSGEALAAVGELSGDLTEDQELWARLVGAGVPVAWVHDVRVRDEKPPRLSIAVQHGVVWIVGRRAARRRNVRPAAG